MQNLICLCLITSYKFGCFRHFDIQFILLQNLFEKKIRYYDVPFISVLTYIFQKYNTVIM